MIRESKKISDVDKEITLLLVEATHFETKCHHLVEEKYDLLGESKTSNKWDKVKTQCDERLTLLQYANSKDISSLEEKLDEMMKDGIQLRKDLE